MDWWPALAELALLPVAGIFPSSLADVSPMHCPSFVGVNTVLGNVKTSLSGAYHAFDFSKYASRYLAAIAYRFNRRFQLKTLPHRLLVAAVAIGPRPETWLRLAEDSC
jgi:hypothetical protein